MSRSPLLFSSDDEDEVIPFVGPEQEAEALKKFQMMLQGVPPPTSVTMSKLSVTDMLLKYKENESLFGFNLSEVNPSRKSSYKNSTPLVYYSNSSQISEEIANLSQKVQSRYIYLETMSSCNIWFDTVVKTNSAKKQSSRRNGLGLSPGNRLSHLARRRQVFSCENLQQLANSDRRRHFEIKKESALKARTLERNKTVKLEKVNSFKRALFLSPDDEESKKLNSSSNTFRRNLFPSSQKTTEESGRGAGVSKHYSQNNMGGSSKKRKRTESRESNGHWPRRALTFTEEDSNKYQETDLRNAKVISELQLSLHHKSKLLWAVSVTLKEKNMSSKDPRFKTCASALFMICRKNLGKILSSKKEGGTSEKMLHFAREQIGGIFKKLGIPDNASSEQTDRAESCASSSLLSNRDCSESTKEGCSSCEATSVGAGNSHDDNESNIETGEAQTSISEKENLDVCENSSSSC